MIDRFKREAFAEVGTDGVGVAEAAPSAVALHVEKLKGFGQDTVSSLAIYIREMKK